MLVVYAMLCLFHFSVWKLCCTSYCLLLKSHRVCLTTSLFQGVRFCVCWIFSNSLVYAIAIFCYCVWTCFTIWNFVLICMVSYLILVSFFVLFCFCSMWFWDPTFLCFAYSFSYGLFKVLFHSKLQNIFTFDFFSCP